MTAEEIIRDGPEDDFPRAYPGSPYSTLAEFRLVQERLRSAPDARLQDGFQPNTPEDDARLIEGQRPKLAVLRRPKITRELELTSAANIVVRPVHWLWELRLPLGHLALLGGREGVGKSTLAYTLAAHVTLGLLPGQCHGEPRAVIVAATEDSWEHTIGPRLMAAGADLALIYRINVAGGFGGPTLPEDIDALEAKIIEVGAVMLLLDPLMSRLDANLDTHKDAEVRQALEPLTALADRTNIVVLGLIHVNKGNSTDPLTLLMASRAFAAVPRSILFMMRDPDDETRLLVGHPKSNLGQTQPTLACSIDEVKVADTDEGPVISGRLRWLGEDGRTIRDVLESGGDGAEYRSATGEAADWLHDYLTMMGGPVESADAKRAGQKAGHSLDALKRARDKIGATATSHGFPRSTRWELPSGSNNPVPA